MAVSLFAAFAPPRVPHLLRAMLASGARETRFLEARAANV